ncbi:unnamed protein product [Prorocentrum cordatum]|uniref:EGF-like domain-containing protein n=1 Tax=Prorocentrum cordatum TaxID=2364126 RepID=A0ABN9S1D5_9DINO|nr:unnamed protein product [Polarella glacialis]
MIRGFFFFVFIFRITADSCSSSEDCEYNGACISSVCHCAPQWQGPSCGELNLLPAPRKGGLHLPNQSTWGGSVIRDPHRESLYHMFASRIAGTGCDIRAWSPNSEIVRATSTNPLGPFRVVETVLHSFAHGPTIHQTSDGYLLFHIGCGRLHGRALQNCSRSGEAELMAAEASVRAKMSSDVQEPCNSDWIAVSHAPSLEGPWNQVGPLVDASNWTWFGRGVTNPAPLVYANGSVLLLYRGHRPEKLGASLAPRWDGVYHTVGKVPLFQDGDEDPFLWQAADGIIHGVTHWMGQSSGAGGGGRHIWSADGLAWRVSNTLAFHTQVTWDDGVVEQVTCRERPQILTDASSGLPLVLYNGVQPTGPHLRGSTFTMAQEICQVASCSKAPATLDVWI